MTRAHVVRLSRIGEATADAWRGLSRRALEPNPYFDVDFLRATHRHLAPGVDPLVMTAWDDATLIGVLPCVELPRWHGLPVRARTAAAPLGSTVADLHTPLLAPEAALPAAAALLSAGTAGRAPVVVELPLLGADGEVRPTLERAARRLGASTRRWESGERGAVVPSGAAHAGAGRGVGAPVPVAVDDLVGHLSTSRRKSVRRTARALADAYGALTWRDRSADPAAVDDFVQMETAGWKGRAERGGQGVAVLDGGTAWLRDLTDGLRAGGRLFVGELAAGDRPVYLTITYRSGGCWFGGRDAYDQDLQQFGPGVLGRLAEQWWARGQGAAFLDSCVNPAVYPDTARLYPDRRGVVSLVVSRGLVGRGILASSAAVHERRKARAG